MVLDINIARAGKKNAQAQAMSREVSHINIFQKIKADMVPIFYHTLETAINDQLRRSGRSHQQLSFRSVSSRIETSYDFRATSTEYFEILTEVFKELETNYKAAGYDVDIERRVSNGSHLGDFYSCTIKC